MSSGYPSRGSILLAGESTRRSSLPRGERAFYEAWGFEPKSSDPFVRLLRDDGYAVTFAEGTAEAMSRLDRDPVPCVLIADIQTPRLDSILLGKYARSRYPLLPIMLVTSYPERIEQALLELDPTPLLFKKPLEYERFRVELRRVIRKNSASLRLDAGAVPERAMERRWRGSR